MQDEQLVIFKLGTQVYAFPISQVREIIQYDSATIVPNASNYIEGIINLRGKVIAVINLANRFQLVVEGQKAQRAIIVDTDQQQLAVIVDEVTEVKYLDNRQMDTLEVIDVRNECVRGVVQDGERLLILLDAGKLTAEKENICREICG